MRHRSIIDVHLILRRADGAILLLRRDRTGYGDGMLALPSGHLERDETAAEAVRREAMEEVGVAVDQADLRLLHVLHRAGDGGSDRLGLFYLADRWTGSAVNAEPGRCSELVWADPANLPPDVIAYPAQGIHHGLAGLPYGEFGWPATPAVAGLAYGTVQVVKHDPAWFAHAAAHTGTVRATLDGAADRVEHVGSTAVQGLTSKPIIDVAVRLHPDAHPAEVIAALHEANYQFRGDKHQHGGMLFVAEPTPGVRVAHLHVLTADDPQWDRYLRVRDRLRGDRQLVAAYSRLKQRLAAEHPDDRAAYTAGKAEFLQQLAAEKHPAVTATSRIQRVRALLVTPAGRLLVIRRAKPGEEPFWMLPGGDIEPDDASLEDACRREVAEETGGQADLHQLIGVCHVGERTHAIFLARITTWDPATRSGPELATNGTFDLEELPLDADTLADGRVWPAPALESIAEHLRAGQDLFTLPDLRETARLDWCSVRRPAPWDGPIAMVTGSRAKHAIAADHVLAYGIDLEHVDLSLPELQSTDVAVIAAGKAKHAYAELGRPLIVEDSGFGLDDLAGYPGALVKHLITAGGATAVAHLADLTATRACTSTAALAYADAYGVVTFTHRRTGHLARQPVGESDQLPLWTVYIPLGAHQPLAALPHSQQRAFHDDWSQTSVFAQFARWYGRHRDIWGGA
ncbi:non-canonical purine NTP pyrophosphatase [Hamadaea sp. NPDC051192]|uniref:non-canonical purine NTP pyrophosphatase n=1 Tax=Hamadaea sp. NPDC051192 TaxID=3154940 RepID=UPI00341495CF